MYTCLVVCLDFSTYAHASRSAVSVENVHVALICVRASRWRFASGAALCGAGFFAWRALRGLPLRQILVLVAKMKDRVPEQVETALNSGEGTRLILVGLLRPQKIEQIREAVPIVGVCPKSGVHSCGGLHSRR